MPDTYDTAEIRVTARRVLGVANEVEELSSRNVNTIQENLREGFQGLAADALHHRLNEVGESIVHISRGLEGVSRDLMAFARRLDAADREIARNIGGN